MSSILSPVVQGQDNGSAEDVIQLVHGQAHVLSAGLDETIRLTYQVHDDAKHVYCAMSGADDHGDADLYVRWSQPVDFINVQENTVSIVCESRTLTFPLFLCVCVCYGSQKRSHSSCISSSLYDLYTTVRP